MRVETKLFAYLVPFFVLMTVVYAIFTSIVPHAPRNLRTLNIELVEDLPWHNDKGFFETWDLDDLADNDVRRLHGRALHSGEVAVA